MGVGPQVRADGGVTQRDMALMRTVYPLDFVRVKTAMAASPQRDPIKRPKDALQAQIVQRLWDDCLVQLK